MWTKPPVDSDVANIVKKMFVHLCNNVGGSAEHGLFLLKLFRLYLTRPGQKTKVCPMLSGLKGSGKSELIEVIMNCIGIQGKARLATTATGSEVKKLFDPNSKNGQYLDNSILVALDEFKMEYVGSMSSQAQMNGWVTNYNAGEWGGYAVRSTPER